MHNSTYHPLEGDNLKNILDNTTETEKKMIIEQVEKANREKLRKYRIVIIPPDAKGRGGTWYDIDNGIVIGSCREAP